jgi:hypothetical protein
LHALRFIDRLYHRCEMVEPHLLLEGLDRARLLGTAKRDWPS